MIPKTVRGIPVLRLVMFASLAISWTSRAQTPADNQSQPAATAAPADQPAAPAEAAPRKKVEEEIVVTGSRVRRKDLATPAPVTVTSKEQIQSSGRRGNVGQPGLGTNFPYADSLSPCV